MNGQRQARRAAVGAADPRSGGPTVPSSTRFRPESG
jgi:hypothetical protein